MRGTKREAARLLAERETQVSKGEYVRPGQGTFGEWLQEWLDDDVATSVRPKTADGYAFIVRKYIAPQIGHIPLRGLQPTHIQGLYSGMLAAGLSANTTRHAHAVIRRALSEGVRMGRIGRNVALSIRAPRLDRREMRTFSAPEAHRFLAAAQDSPYHVVFVTLLWSGARRSEVLGLTWRNVDLLLSTISITHALHVLPNGLATLVPPKSAKGRRQIALPPSLALALTQHRWSMEQLRGSLPDDAFVFTMPDGRPMLPDSVTHAFKRIARKAGLEGIRLHDLRHTHASLMLGQGVHPKVVSECLGHSSIAITLDVYSHVSPGIQKAAAEVFDKALSDALPVNGSVDKTQAAPLTIR